MSEKLLNELDTYQTKLGRTRERFAADGKITEQEQKKLDALEEKIDLIINALAVAGGAIVVEGDQPSKEPPPNFPLGEDGKLRYKGLPLDKLPREYQKNQARASARKVRDGMKSVDGWTEQLDDKSKRHAGQRQAYDANVNNRKDVDEAFAQDLKRGKFRKLSKAAGGNEFTDSLAAYEKASSEVKQNTILLEAKAWRLAAAQAMVDQAESLLETYEQEKKRDAESKKLAETKQKLQNIQNFVAFYKEAAVDPMGTAKKLGLQIANDLVDKFLVDLLGGGVYERVIKQIEARIAQINQRLEELKFQGLKSGLDEALNTVKAEQTETKQIWEALDQAKREQGQAVDALATMESDNPGTTTVFGELQEYYDNLQEAGVKTLETSRELQSTIQRTDRAMQYTDDLRMTVLQDSSMMRSLYDGDWANWAVLEQDRHAKAIVEYTKKMDKWYESQQVDRQLEEQHRLQAELLQNQQFNYIGDLVNKVQEEGLGHKQRDSKITR